MSEDIEQIKRRLLFITHRAWIEARELAQKKRIGPVVRLS